MQDPVAGIVCEYNPLHSGHVLHLRRTREVLPGCGIICVMSGNFVQRGEPAVLRKYARAAAAVEAGADVVFELPCAHALSPAGIFARRSIELLAATGIVTHVSFGCECGDAAALTRAAEAEGTPEFTAALRRGLENGASAAAAVTAALPDGVGELLSRPNNLLGAEYIRAMRDAAPQLIPIAIKREGDMHDSGSLCASSLRKLFISGVPLPDGSVPSQATALYEAERTAGRAPVDAAVFAMQELFALRRASASELAAYAEVTEGLENRIVQTAAQSATLEKLLASLKTRRYTYARLRRIACCALLGITRSLQTAPAPYLRVLAVGRGGRELLARMKASAALPIIAKPAAIKELQPQAQYFAETEARADSIYALGYSEESGRLGGFWTTTPYITEGDD